MSSALNRKLRQAQARLQDGDAVAAEALCIQVLREAPRNPDALFLFGSTQLSLGRAEAAVEPLRRALAADPRNGAAAETLGLAFLMLGRFADAQSILEDAARIPGAPASVFMRLGVSILEQGNAVDAIPALRKAATMDAAEPDSHLNLGRALAAMGEVAEARSRFQTALTIAPHCADAAFNLGVLAMQQAQWLEARRHYRTALAIDPSHSAAHERLGALAIALGAPAEAVPHLRAYLDAEPHNAEALSALAQSLYELGQLDEAETTAGQALELDPNDAAAYATLANRHLVRGETDRAIAQLESGYARTGASGLLGMLAYQLRQVCDWARWQEVWTRMVQELEQGAGLGSPFWLLCQPTTPEQQLAYSVRWVAARFDAVGSRPKPARRNATARARLKIGYLSSDLHEHATAYLIAEVLELHDRSRFEIFAYSYGPEDGSPMRSRLRAACEHFVDIARESDESAAERIRADQLDALVDLKGYTVGDRLGIMARRPCAVQATWLGYPGTTGAAFIDYLIADAFVVPEHAEPHYSEKILRLPHCYQPNDRKRSVAAPLTRTQYGLPQDALVLCCFNQTYKITPETFDVWLRVLSGAPNSVLWLYQSNPFARDNLFAHAHARGIGEERIVFAPRMQNAQHLARYAAADLALDTFPYTSHTTLSDALWCGCPTLALCGETFAARVSASLLTAARLPELIAYSLAEYEQLLVRLVTDRSMLAALRVRVASARACSPLFDSAAFTRDLESLYARLVRGDR